MIDKQYWKKIYFTDKSFPELLCPTCNKGLLKPILETFQKQETSWSKNARQHEDWYPDWIDYRFIILFKCSNDKCNDVITCTGKGVNEPGTEYDSHFDTGYETFVPTYFPSYFIPELKIIKVHEKYSKEVKIQLLNSFSHFFHDLTSCANKIRICIEVLMDEFNIPKIETTKKKIRNLNLHERILIYNQQNSGVANSLLAIKWIGNFGSHYETLTKDDILDAYDLLDFALEKIYVNHEKEISELAENIIKNKAPLSKNKKSSI